MQQQAGENGMQLQAGNDMTVIQNAQIVLNDTQVQALATAFTGEARQTGAERAGRMSSRLLATLQEEGNLPVLAEPDFQALLAKAAIGAAQTEDEDDYGILTSILADRARIGNVRRRRIGLDRAIEVADKVDTPILRALAASYLAFNTAPGHMFMQVGLAVQDGMLARVMGDEPLPTPGDFINHADLLDLVRVNPLGPFNSVRSWWGTVVPGWAAAGVSRIGDEWLEVHGGLVGRGLSNGDYSLVVNEFDSTRLRLGYSAPRHWKEHLESLERFTEAQILELMRFADSVFQLRDSPGDYAEQVLDKTYETTHLGSLLTWLGNMPNSFTLTSAGVVLARAYAEHVGAAATVTGWADMPSD